MTNYQTDQAMRAVIRRHVRKMQAKGVVYKQSALDELYKNPRKVTEDMLKYDTSRYASWQRFDDYARIGESVSEVYSQSGTPTKLSEPMTVMASKKGFSGSELNQDLESLARLKHPEALADLHARLERVASILAGEMPKPGMENQYFTIDEDWSGRQSDLWQHITFADDVKKGGKAGATIYDDIKQMYTNNPYLKRTSTYEEDWREKSYQSNLKAILDDINKGLDPEDQMSIDDLEVLRDIMNTSAAWKLAARMGYDSLQEAWRDLTLQVKEAEKGDDKLWSDAKQLLRNWDQHTDPYGDLQDLINKGLGNILKGVK